jgi:hypothetical protein
MYYDDDPPAGDGCLRAAVIIAIAILALGGLFYFGINRATANLNPFNGATLPNPLAPAATAITVDRPAVIRQMQALNRLETYTYLTDQVITAERGGNAFYNFFAGDKLLLVASGEVVAGFDLAKLREQDVVISADGGSATVTLPPAEILISRIDNEKTKVYSRDTGIFTQGDPGLESEARRVAEQQIVQAACEAGILDRAATEGKRSIENLVKAFGIDNVQVNAYPGQCEAPADLAQPAPSQPTQ